MHNSKGLLMGVVYLSLLVTIRGLQVLAETNQNPAASGAANEGPAKVELQPLKIRVVFFTPHDRQIPTNAVERITKIADYMEKFFFDGMKHWNYPPAVPGLIQRDPDGTVQILSVQGDESAASGKYDKPDYAPYVIEKVSKKYGIKSSGDIWWIFVYLGDPPARFNVFKGGGQVRRGGWAMVNYDSSAGEIRSDQSMVEGFNGKYFLKGSIHELGHAFGLPHIGPDQSLGLGNTLMGPATVVYERRKGANADKVYLDEACAAMLWKHPFFSGIDKDRSVEPKVELADYSAAYNETNNSVTITGKLVSDRAAHSMVVIDDRGRPRDEYWFRAYPARLASDGTFRVTINKPAKADGKYRILFCFNSGVVTGDGRILFGDQSAIQKTYHFHEKKFEFEN